MALLPKTIIKWHEPASFRRAYENRVWTSARWVRVVGIGLLYSAMFIVIGLMARTNPNKNPPGLQLAIPVAIMGGLFLSIFITLMNDWAPRQIKVTEKGIMWTHYRSAQMHKLENIARVVLLKVCANDKEWSVLQIQLGDKRVECLGISPRQQPDAVAFSMQQHGYRVVDCTRLPCRGLLECRVPC